MTWATPPIARQARDWAERALAALPTVKSMPAWIVANAPHLAVLDLYLPPLREKVQAAIVARWDELDPPQAKGTSDGQ